MGFEAMRVLLVNQKGWLFGGVERYLGDIAVGLSERGHRLALVTTEPCPQGREPLDDVYEHRLRLDPEASEAAQKARLDDLLASFRPDVAYAHKPPEIPAVMRLPERLPLARYVHDHDPYCPRRHKYYPYPTRICTAPMGLRCLLRGCLVTRSGPVPGLPWISGFGPPAARRAAARRADAIAVGSPWMRDMLGVNGFDLDRVRVIPPVPRGLERPPQDPSGEPVVLFVGQVVRGKGLDLLLRALSVARSPCRLLVAGAGNHLPGCVALARDLGLGDRVTFLGWVPHDRLGAYRRRARVVAVPSRWPEPFGMVGVEAMWASRPVAGFAVGGIPSWLEDGVTGISAPEGDWRALGEAVGRLVQDRDLAARLGGEAHQRARERYRFDPGVDETEELLDSARSSHRASTRAGAPS